MKPKVRGKCEVIAEESISWAETVLLTTEEDIKITDKSVSGGFLDWILIYPKQVIISSFNFVIKISGRRKALF